MNLLQLTNMKSYIGSIIILSNKKKKMVSLSVNFIWSFLNLVLLC